MSLIPDRYNNPGDLTVCGPGQKCDNQIIYPGQTGTATSLNGFTYAVFGAADDGFYALEDYISRHLDKWGTSSQFVGGYLGVKNLQPTSANANPSGYLSTFDRIAGVTSTQPLTDANVYGIALGITHAEGGHYQAHGDLMNDPNAFDSAGQLMADSTHNALQGFRAMGAAITGQTVQGVTPQAANAAIGTVAGNAASAVTSPFNGLASAVAGVFSASFAERAALVVLGLLLIGAAVVALAKPQGVTLADAGKLALAA